MRVLVVEDEIKMASLIRRGLRSEGLAADVAIKGEDALWMAGSTGYDAIVLDVMLPGRDGTEVCRTLRGRGCWAPVLMLTARDAVDDRVAGLDAGADDYLPKPFSLAELQARLRALHRRGKVDPELLRSGPLELDTTARELRVNGTSVELTGTELALLEYLMRNPGVVLSRDQLREQVWGDGFEPASNVVDIYVHYVRRKLKRAGADQDPIRTVRGLGYSFRRAD
jgi:two-component system OmpR family response regulator